MRIDKMSKVKILDEASVDILAPLVVDYFLEMHPDTFIGDEDVAREMLLTMLKSNQFIYYLVNNEDIPIGYITMWINTQHKMTTPHLVLDYMYVIPSERPRGIATAKLFTTGAKVAIDLSMDIVASTLINSNNMRNAKVVEAEEVARCYKYTVDTFKDRYSKYLNKYFNKGSK